MTKIAIFLGSANDRNVTTKGLALLEKYRIPFTLRIASAHRTPEHLSQLVERFDTEGVCVYVCVAGMSAHLAGVVAAHTLKPVLAVPVVSEATGGLDALLSMVNMPPGVPVATLGFGGGGFTNATLFAMQLLATHDEKVRHSLQEYRQSMVQQVMASDLEHGINFTP